MRWFSHRLFIILSALLLATPAWAQCYPTRPITLIVPYAPGGSVDAVARVIASRISEKLGQNIVIENVAADLGRIRMTTRFSLSFPRTAQDCL